MTTPTGPDMFHLLQLKYALKLEIGGMRHSRGSVYAYVKRMFGFRGNKAKVLAQLEAHITVKDKEYQDAKNAGQGNQSQG